MTVTWCTTNDIRLQLQKLWDRGVLLSWMIDGLSPFPLRLRFKSPTSREISSHFDEVRKWISDVNALPNCRLVSREYRHQTFAKNAVPEELWIDTVFDAAAWLDRGQDLSRFSALVETTRQRLPSLLHWVRQKPLTALAHSGEWNGIIDVLLWMQTHTRPGIHIRQVDISGVHSKFIEQRKPLFLQLFDQTLPEEAIDRTATGVAQFERRFGFNTKPERIRFRILDDPARDITLDSDSFAQLNPSVRSVFIVENEINFLCFPSLTESMVVFGAGYGFGALGKAKWLVKCDLFYWGDIDTHGFAILSNLRSYFPHVQSLLMDESTILRYRDLWGEEREPHPATQLANLTEAEAHVYQMIKTGQWQDRLRIEQEHIGWDYASLAVEAAINYSDLAP